MKPWSKDAAPHSRGAGKNMVGGVSVNETTNTTWQKHVTTQEPIALGTGS
jgi:hypothetical protein